MSATSEYDEERVRTLLRTRADRLRATPHADVETAVTWMAEFPLGPDAWAVPLASLRACLPLRGVTRVPLAKPHILGIARFRGQTITAISLASLLGVRGWSEDPSVLLIVEPRDGQLLAFDCEKVPRPVAVPSAALEAARARTPGGVTEVALGTDRLLHVVDLGRLVAEGERGP